MSALSVNIWAVQAMENAPAPLPAVEFEDVETVDVEGALDGRADAAAGRDLDRRVRLAQSLVHENDTYVWGAVSALLTAAVSSVFLPVEAVVLLAVLGGALGFLGHIDARTKLILNTHTLAFTVLTVTGLLALQVGGWPGPVLLAAVGTALGVFLVMIALWWFAGFASGGDIKLAPVVAAGLSFISPLTACLWLLTAFILSLAVMVWRAVRTRQAQVGSVPMAPLMALALPLSVAGTFGLYASLGMPAPGA